MDAWFTVDYIDTATYILSEYRHWEETHCYLVCGGEKALLYGDFGTLPREAGADLHHEERLWRSGYYEYGDL